MENVQTILQRCTIEGTTVKLPPGQLDRKIYQEVAKQLNLIGGAWKGHKIMGFVFPNDPTELLNQIASGTKRNLQKEFQFFPTPDHLADRLVKLAKIRERDDILEPSAGQGAIVNAIQRNTWRHRTVYGFELMDINRTFLDEIPGFILLGNDFLKECKLPFDKIIANPPFTKNQDIDHIIKMYKFLKKGGTLVSIASKHWQYANNKKENQFRDWLDEIGAEIIEIPAGEFKESGTTIATCIIVINK